MPGLGPTHEDEEMWGVAAFVRQLPNTSPREYLIIEKWFKENGEGNAGLEEYQLRSQEKWISILKIKYSSNIVRSSDLLK